MHAYSQALTYPMDGILSECRSLGFWTALVGPGGLVRVHLIRDSYESLWLSEPWDLQAASPNKE